MHGHLGSTSCGCLLVMQVAEQCLLLCSARHQSSLVAAIYSRLDSEQLTSLSLKSHVAALRAYLAQIQSGGSIDGSSNNSGGGGRSGSGRSGTTLCGSGGGCDGAGSRSRSGRASSGRRCSRTRCAMIIAFVNCCATVFVVLQGSILTTTAPHSSPSAGCTSSTHTRVNACPVRRLRVRNSIAV